MSSGRRFGARRTAAGAALLAALVLAGCGGPMQPSELKDSLETVESASAEGALIGAHAAADRTKTTFVRTRARQLGETLDHEVEKLSDATAQVGLGADLRDATDIASQAATQVGDLAAAPQDRRAAAGVSARLRRLASKAHVLGQGQ